MMTEASNFVARSSLAGSTVFARIKAEFHQLRGWRMEVVRNHLGWQVRLESEIGGTPWGGVFIVPAAEVLGAKRPGEYIRCLFADAVRDLIRKADMSALNAWLPLDR
jgi:hypothetical protein